MKKIVLLFISIFVILLSGCASTKALEGNWNTVALIVDGEPQEIIESNINFGYDNDIFMAKGLAGVNLYNTKVYIKGHNIRTSNMKNTGFSGIPKNMAYEDLFFRAFINSTTYEIIDDTLILYNPEQKTELQLKKDF